MSHVVLYHCDTKEEIPQRIQAIMDALAMEKITPLFQNRRVLLKPNVCIDHPPEKGATTHLAVLDALINIGKNLGAEIIGCTEVCKYEAISLTGMLVRKDAFLR
jgi:uncharacterized protein (DUF362 family)